jgi:membrane protease YdiL (CAAX protease family)
MLHIAMILGSLILAGYILWDVAHFGRDYRQLKEAIADGNEQARTRFYSRVLVFEWVSALLALVALGFDKTKLTAATLELDGTAFGGWFSSISKDLDRGMIAGVAFGLLIGMIGLVVVRLRARRLGAEQPASARARWLRKLMPDFAALIPSTGRERMIFAVVAVSAGICEEIVFRGWLLFTLHSGLRLTGTALVLIAAAIFGLAHFYQGVPGVIATTAAGLFLCAVYVGTGTLLVPIVLHAFIDLRMAVLPAGRPQVQTAQPA